MRSFSRLCRVKLFFFTFFYTFFPDLSGTASSCGGGGLTTVKNYITSHKYLVPARHQIAILLGTRGRRFIAECYYPYEQSLNRNWSGFCKARRSRQRNCSKYMSCPLETLENLLQTGVLFPNVPKTEIVKIQCCTKSWTKPDSFTESGFTWSC